MDIPKVIYLGHTLKQPLIGPPSELVDGFEPHGLIYLRTVRHGGMVQPGGEEEVYPGWCGQVGTGGVVYRVPT